MRIDRSLANQVTSTRAVTIALALALLTGCVTREAASGRRNGFVTIRATVEAHDPDGLLFDLATNTREFDPGTVARGPLTRVVVCEPGKLAGRRYLIALPDAPAGMPRRVSDALWVRGSTVTFELPRVLVTRGQHEIIEFADLRWPEEDHTVTASGQSG